MEIVLSIAGSDPSAGAGIQQDLKTMTANGVYGATVITALTSQNTMGVTDVMAVPAEVVESQLRTVLDDLNVKAIKIGQIPNAQVAHSVASTLKQFLKADRLIPVIYDPVMISTSGRRLMEADAIRIIEKELIPLCTLITPNIPEASFLSGKEINSEQAITDAGTTLCSKYSTSVLLKGGHAEGNEMKDTLFMTDGTKEIYHTHKIETSNLHGTGCTLSSAIAAFMAKGLDLLQAVGYAKAYVTKAIAGGKDLQIGHGNGPLWASSSDVNEIK